MRIYDPNPATLRALRGSIIELVLDVPNSDLQALASDPSVAAKWVKVNVRDYFPDVKIRYIAVGNEVNPSGGFETAQFAPFVLPAMQNVYRAIEADGLQDQIKVSTATYSALVSESYPPSNSSFRADARLFMNPIIGFLFGYRNLFDAMLDAMYYAVEKAGGPQVEIVVSESGWPSGGGGGAATMDNAGTYYRNLIRHVERGTPKKPNKAIETYLFAMFDENQKAGAETERHFGLFHPNKQPKYRLSLN
ncbi:beta-1,3-glucanase 3 [Actinidia rufa]|uniref:Beta-1,3-glucanase 3 n=1 Tax=Actinidia rufa TaxID=165716 RepID=A0A7J0H4X5_9ERIC|nr:beta-1,3-glucanase 3 [Actinidia rufa]